jgi:hypothetical protein
MRRRRPVPTRIDSLPVLLSAALMAAVWAAVRRVVRMPPPVLDVRIAVSRSTRSRAEVQVPLLRAMARLVDGAGAGARR